MLATDRGVEPRFWESKSHVLPLNESALYILYYPYLYYTGFTVGIPSPTLFIAKKYLCTLYTQIKVFSRYILILLRFFMQKILYSGGFYAENICWSVYLSNAPHPSLYTAGGAMGDTALLLLAPVRTSAPPSLFLLSLLFYTPTYYGGCVSTLNVNYGNSYALRFNTRKPLCLKA